MTKATFTAHRPLEFAEDAFVHAFDTEAHIGQRPTAEKVQLEKMFIKEKINQTERVQLFLENGGDNSTIVQFIFNDAARLAESVKTRTEVMKMELLQKGEVTVNENDVTMKIDFNVPAANKGQMDFSAKADILGQIQELIDKAADAGQKITSVVTTRKVLLALRKNETVQKSINGVNGVGVFISDAQLNSLMQEQFGLTLTTNDERYLYEGKKGALTTRRYIDENQFICYSPLPSGALGAGLWGATPEETSQGQWTAKNQNQFITITQWKEADPVAVWTKASGLFVPVLPNPRGLFPQTVKLS